MDSRQGLIVAKGVEFARRAGGLRQTMRHTKAINMKNAPSSPIGQTFEVQTRGETACRTTWQVAMVALLLRRAPIAAVPRSTGRYPPCNKMYHTEDAPTGRA